MANQEPTELTVAQEAQLSDRTLKGADLEYRWGPFKLTVKARDNKVTVSGYVRIASRDLKLGSATLTANKTEAKISAKIDHVAKAEVLLRVDFSKRTLKAGFKSCVKKSDKYKCNPKNGHSWRTLLTW